VQAVVADYKALVAEAVLEVTENLQVSL